MQQVQTQIAGMPLTLVLLSDGCVVIVVTGALPTIFEQGSVVNASIFADGFILTTENKPEEEFSYNVVYYLQDYPLLKQWLRQQQLRNPFTGEYGTT